MKQSTILSRTLLLVCGLASGAFAQSLATTYASDNGQSGVMFDVAAINNVSICTFDVNLAPGAWDVRIYRLPAATGYATQATNPGAWTLLGTTSGVVSAGLNVPTPLPIFISVPIAAGTSQAFYIATTNGLGIKYTTGGPGSAGTVYASDANLRIHVGSGVPYPFQLNLTPRILNGTIHYQTSGSCPAPPYALNQPNSSLDVNGVIGDGNNPVVVNVCVGQPLTANFAGPAGAPFELLSTVGVSAVSAYSGGVFTTHGQALNINLFHPSFSTLFNFAFNVPLVPAPLPFSVSVPGVIRAGQMVVLDPTNLDGFSLSQAPTLITSTAGTVAAGPTGDDSVVAIQLNAQPLCAPPVHFYGQSFTTIYVSSNGRVTFGLGSTSYTPSVAEALSGPPFIGLWTDLNPEAGGVITVNTLTPGQIHVDYSNVRVYGATTQTVDFALEFDIFSDRWRFHALSPLPSLATPAFLGLSLGASGATNPGMAPFTTSSAGSPPTAFGMIYQLGALASVAPGVPSITFIPTTTGGTAGYSWTVP